MKRILFSTLCFILTMTIVNAQSNPKDEMFFDKTLHDFGSMEFGADGTYDFVFKNNSNKPIVLTDVKSSCGCTVPTWAKEPIQPGETSSIRVKYNTTLPGIFNKTVTVYSSAKNSPVRLSIMGKVMARPSDIKTTTTDEKTVSLEQKDAGAENSGQNLKGKTATINNEKKVTTTADRQEIINKNNKGKSVTIKK